MGVLANILGGDDGRTWCFGVLSLTYGMTGVFNWCQRHRLEKLQSWLMSLGEATAVAASIAELLQEKDAKEVLKLAQRHFRCVSADKLTWGDMKDNIPNPALRVHTGAALLGQVDAFVSHSWSDDPHLKWQSLQIWREEFKRVRGREPKLWIDKYCIDQENISDSLACLPVYLAACSWLLVLCGKTYLSRLWCVVEIFVFVEMGGTLENLHVSLCGDASEIDGTVRNFSTKNARCFTAADTTRLQDVVQATHAGRIDKFIKHVFHHRVFDTKANRGVADNRHA